MPRLYYGVAALLCSAKLLIHLLTNHQYGYFRDELYFLDCGRHLAWGYADMAPAAAFFAKLGLMLGGSLREIRFSVAVAGAVLVLLAILLARELGGGKFAQFLSGFCALAAIAYLIEDGFLSMNAFEPPAWMACILVLLRIVRTGNSRLWLWFGLFAGLGLENKHSTLFFGLAVVCAILLTSLRREFLKPWIWLGGLVAFLVFLPNLLWEAQHHFATIELLRNVQRMHKNVVLGPVAYFGHQLLSLNPLEFLVWGAGLVWLFSPAGRRFRVLAWTYVALFALFVLFKGKDYYLFPIYPMLMAAGAVAWEQWSQRRTWIRPVLVMVILFTSAILAPLALPVFTPDRLLVYQQRLHIQSPKSEVAHNGPLPQYFGDQFGWAELAAEVAHDYNSLPEELRSRTVIFANNYGEAGAINLFGPKFGLPTAISAHQNHYFWGPPPPNAGAVGSNVIVLQGSVQDLSRRCDSVQVLSVHFHPWGMAEENRPILLCQGLKVSLQQLWPELKLWN
ncbi:MAG TPA: glycosyltransferase family 39 protein [Candidatus Angelobacter sp.]|nr:glycosyltransferase family 39 protein [Candidatus Angelobacter sp.]